MPTYYHLANHVLLWLEETGAMLLPRS